MLDQNTDRTWWMIAAVVIGSALFVTANWLFPGALDAAVDKLTSSMGITITGRPS